MGRERGRMRTSSIVKKALADARAKVRKNRISYVVAFYPSENYGEWWVETQHQRIAGPYHSNEEAHKERTRFERAQASGLLGEWTKIICKNDNEKL